jgi:hypothetical protein
MLTHQNEEHIDEFYKRHLIFNRFPAYCMVISYLEALQIFTAGEVRNVRNSKPQHPLCFQFQHVLRLLQASVCQS